MLGPWSPKAQRMVHHEHAGIWGHDDPPSCPDKTAVAKKMDKYMGGFSAVHWRPRNGDIIWRQYTDLRHEDKEDGMMIFSLKGASPGFNVIMDARDPLASIDSMYTTLLNHGCLIIGSSGKLLTVKTEKEDGNHASEWDCIFRAVVGGNLRTFKMGLTKHGDMTGAKKKTDVGLRHAWIQFYAVSIHAPPPEEEEQAMANLLCSLVGREPPFHDAVGGSIPAGVDQWGKADHAGSSSGDQARQPSAQGQPLAPGNPPSEPTVDVMGQFLDAVKEFCHPKTVWEHYPEMRYYPDTGLFHMRHGSGNRLAFNVQEAIEHLRTVVPLTERPPARQLTQIPPAPPCMLSTAEATDDDWQLVSQAEPLDGTDDRHPPPSARQLTGTPPLPPMSGYSAMPSASDPAPELPKATAKVAPPTMAQLALDCQRTAEPAPATAKAAPPTMAQLDLDRQRTVMAKANAPVLHAMPVHEQASQVCDTLEAAAIQVDMFTTDPMNPIDTHAIQADLLQSTMHPIAWCIVGGGPGQPLAAQLPLAPVTEPVPPLPTGATHIREQGQPIPCAPVTPPAASLRTETTYDQCPTYIGQGLPLLSFEPGQHEWTSHLDTPSDLGDLQSVEECHHRTQMPQYLPAPQIAFVQSITLCTALPAFVPVRSITTAEGLGLPPPARWVMSHLWKGSSDANIRWAAAQIGLDGDAGLAYKVEVESFLAKVQFRCGRTKRDVTPRLLTDHWQKMRWDDQPTPAKASHFGESVAEGPNASPGLGVRYDADWDSIDDFVFMVRELETAGPDDLGDDWRLVPPPAKVHCQVVYVAYMLYINFV